MATNVTALAASLAALQQQVKEGQTASRISWLLFCGSLVFFMQCGFSMLEAGAVRSKATQVVLLKNLFDVSLGGVLWWLVGFSFANGTGSSFIGFASPPGQGTLFAMAGLSSDDDEQPTDFALAFFQFTFAAAAATIVSGAVAERALLPAYLAFSAVTTGFVYPVVMHWVWSSSGWLSVYNPHPEQRFLTCGVIDFAGAGVVHMTGGIAAIVGAKIIGPRTGRFDADGRTVPMPGHSSVLQVLGTFILWLGWYGFTAGSTLGMDTAQKAHTAARVVLITTLAGAAGGIASVTTHRYYSGTRTWDVSAMCNGILAGLVSVTAGCATVSSWAGLLMGGIGGLIYRVASHLIRGIGIDDPLDASAVHGAGGMWGVLATSLLSTPSYTKSVLRCDCPGLFYGGGRLLGAAVVFIVCHIAWVGTISTLLFLLLRYLGCLRVPKHADHAYSWGAGSERGVGSGDRSDRGITGAGGGGTMQSDHAAACHVGGHAASDAVARKHIAHSLPAAEIMEIEATDVQVRVSP